MTPLESELLQQLGTSYLYSIEELSIAIFFYGASSSLVVVYGSSTSSIKVSLLYFSLCRLLSSGWFSLSCESVISWQDLISRDFTGREDFPTAR